MPYICENHCYYEKNEHCNDETKKCECYDGFYRNAGTGDCDQDPYAALNLCETNSDCNQEIGEWTQTCSWDDSFEIGLCFCNSTYFYSQEEGICKPKPVYLPSSFPSRTCVAHGDPHYMYVFVLFYFFDFFLIFSYFFLFFYFFFYFFHYLYFFILYIIFLFENGILFYINLRKKIFKKFDKK